MTTTRPQRDEAAEYFFRYIDKVPDGDIVAILKEQQGQALSVLRGITEERSLHRYEPGKWTLREVLGHLNDTERLFVFRAMWFARGLEEPLPSFDQDIAVAASGANERSWSSHVAEFEALRTATLALFEHLPADAWMRRGTASGNPFSVRALAYATAGHVVHHVEIIRTRYLV